jgi:YD repeat-containing protein
LPLILYKGINERVSITDAENNTTIYTYDMPGRRLSRLHPDAGLTECTYDTAGNMLRPMTANLRENKQPITYDYESSFTTLFAT